MLPVSVRSSRPADKRADPRRPLGLAVPPGLHELIHAFFCRANFKRDRLHSCALVIEPQSALASYDASCPGGAGALSAEPMRVESLLQLLVAASLTDSESR